jgi:hypothetical protein
MKHFKQISLAMCFLYIGLCGGVCCPVAPNPVSLQESFEDGLTAWDQGSDVPEDPNNPGQPVAWSIQQSDSVSLAGDFSARYFLDGSQDDGTIWLMQALQAEAGHAYTVDLSLDFWSASESFNTIAKVALYTGAEAPTAEEDFDTSRAANQAEGWKTYNLQAEVAPDTDGEIWVAFGISAVWETEMTYFIDNVQVEAVPAP